MLFKLFKQSSPLFKLFKQSSRRDSQFTGERKAACRDDVDLVSRVALFKLFKQNSPQRGSV